MILRVKSLLLRVKHLNLRVKQLVLLVKQCRSVSKLSKSSSVPFLATANREENNRQEDCHALCPPAFIAGITRA